MSDQPYRALVLSVVKHDYIARAVEAHPRFQLVAVCDDADVPAWVHERHEMFAEEFDLPCVRDLDEAIVRFQPDLAVISSEAE